MNPSLRKYWLNIPYLKSGLNFKVGDWEWSLTAFRFFFGNERASGMEIGSFGVGSKTFVMKRFSRNGAHRLFSGQTFSAKCRGMR